MSAKSEGIAPPGTVRTIYCLKLHRLSDGRGVGHRCRVLDPGVLRAEAAGDIEPLVTYCQSPLHHPLVIAEGTSAEHLVEDDR